MRAARDAGVPGLPEPDRLDDLADELDQLPPEPDPMLRRQQLLAVLRIAYSSGRSDGYRERELTEAYKAGLEAVRGPRAPQLGPDEDYDNPGPRQLDAAPPANARPPGRTPDGTCGVCRVSAAEEHSAACPFYPPGGYDQDRASSR